MSLFDTNLNKFSSNFNINFMSKQIFFFLMSKQRWSWVRILSIYMKVAPDNKVISPILSRSPANSSGLRAHAWTKHSFGQCTLYCFHGSFSTLFSFNIVHTYALVPLGGAWGVSGLTPQRHTRFRTHHETSFRTFAGRKRFLSTIPCPPDRSFQNAFHLPANFLDMDFNTRSREHSFPYYS